MQQTTEQKINQMWNAVSTEQRVALLKVMGYDTVWSKCNSLEEMAQHGGAMVAKDIMRLWNKRFYN